MDFDRSESGKFAQIADETMGKLTGQVEALLAENAGRGFPAPDGDTLTSILAAGQGAKGKLVEANSKIYEEQRGTIFQQAEFALKLLVSIAKLSMELYREELFNAIAIEQAEVEADRDKGMADVERLNSEIEQRQVAVIRDRAEMERQIAVLKEELVAAETASLEAEETLIKAQLATAEKKLEIIDSIYKVLAAEELVLAAENRRANSLQQVLVAQQILAGIKKEMIPFYIDKAEAREELADAVIKEIPIREALEKLGYDRIALKDSDEAANHLIRAAENEFELTRELWTKANKATELARVQARRVLQEYSNEIRASILEKKEALEKKGIGLKLGTALARRKISVDSEVAIDGHEVGNLNAEITNILANIVQRTNAHVAAINASANITENITNYATNFRWQTVI